MPGFAPVADPVAVERTAAEAVREDPPSQRKEALARLRRDGFRVEAWTGLRNLKGPYPQQGGLSEVLVLGSAAAARREQSLSVRGSIKSLHPSRLFRVSGVPGALGVASPGGHLYTSAANAYAIEGSCVVIVADSVAGADYIQPVQIAIRTIYRRTHGVCPYLRP
jgi:hypothetical protein